MPSTFAAAGSDDINIDRKGGTFRQLHYRKNRYERLSTYAVDALPANNPIAARKSSKS